MPQPTFADHNAASLANVAERLRVIAAGLDAVAHTAKELEPHGVESFRINRQTSLTDGMRFLLSWKQAAEQAVDAKMTELGMFGSAPAGPRPGFGLRELLYTHSVHCQGGGYSRKCSFFAVGQLSRVCSSVPRGRGRM